MTSIRRHLQQHRAIVALVFAATLLMRVFVPSGFMPTVDHGVVTIVLCSGSGPQTVQMAMPGMHGSEHPGGGERHDRSPAPCLFSGLATPALTGADPFLLAAAILFVMLQAFHVPDRRQAATRTRLRPPLRGPPIRS